MTDHPEQNFSSQPARRQRRLARSTLLVICAFAGAKLISLVQTVVIAQVFGLSAELDAYVAANGLPELIYTLIAGGAMAHAFIPIFSGLLARGNLDGAWRTATLVINCVFLATLLLSLLTFMAAPWLIATLVAPGFDATAQAQTVILMRILLLTTLIFSVSGICMGILQSHNHFLLPALAPVLYDVGILFGVLFLIPRIGVYGIAWGAVLGAALHLGIQVPGLLRFHARWWPLLDFRDAQLRRILRLMLPRIAGLGVFSLNFLVMNNIASRLGPGSVSALSWGWRVMQIPQTLIGTAMGTVIFPTLAALSELGDDSGKREAMSGALRFILITSIPSAVGLIFLGHPIVSLLERGAFDASASALVTATLRFFALGLVVHAVLEVVARSFYADKDTLTPLWAALGGAAINLAGAFLLSGILLTDAGAGPALFLPLLHTLNLGVSGLALANSLATMFEVGLLLWVLRRRWQSLNEDALARTVLKTTVASLFMALAIVLAEPFLGALLSSPGLIASIGIVGAQVALGGLVFLICALALRMPEPRHLWQLWVMRRTPPEDPLTTEILTLTLGAFATNCYIVGNRETGEALVIDPVDEAAQLVHSANEQGWTIRLILATHGHLDHILAAAELVQLTGAAFQIHRASPRLQPAPPEDVFLQQLFPPLPRPNHCFGDEDEQTGIDGFSLQTIFTPGHAPDHVAFYSPQAGVLFGGDCLFAGSIGRTDFPNADLHTLMRSITQRLMTLPDETRVLPGHMGPTTIGAERSSNPFVLEYLRHGGAAGWFPA